MMHRLSSAIMLGFTGLLLTPAAQAQSAAQAQDTTDEAVAVALSGLRYVMKGTAGAALKLDASSGSLAQILALALHARTGTLEETFQCTPGGGPPSCRLKGASLFVRVEEPTVRSVDATVSLRIWQSVKSVWQPVAVRSLILFLRRTPQGWVVEREEIYETT